MSQATRPLSTLRSQGWEVAGYSASMDPGTGMLAHCFLLKRENRSKVLVVRKKMVGEGIVAEEMDV